MSDTKRDITQDINTIGIIGGGQLARMLALAGIPLGFRFVFLDTKMVAFHPAPNALATAQDRLKEKTLFRELGIATPEFHNIESTADLATAKDFPFPATL